MGDQVWTHKTLQLEYRGEKRTQAGTILQDTLAEKTPEVLTVGSDGSVRLQDGLAACAWILHNSDDEQIKACYLLEKMTSLSSYRSELEGMYRGLQQVLLSGITPQAIEQWCDNEAAVNRSTQPIAHPHDMIAPDADIVLALHATRQRLEGTSINCRHVYGHQDSKRQTHQTADDSVFGLELLDLWRDDTGIAGLSDNNCGSARTGLTLAARVNITATRLPLRQCQQL